MTRTNVSHDWSKPTLAFLLFLAAFSLVDAWRYHQRWPGIDFYQFWAVPQAARQLDSVDVYASTARARIGEEFLARALAPGASERQRRAAERRREVDVYSSPFLYTAFGLPSTGRYELDFRIYFLLSLASLVASIVLLARRLGYGPSGTLAAICALTLPFGAFHSDVRVGNVNQLLLGALVLVLWLLDRASPRGSFLAGAVLGLCVLFKPTVAVVAFVLFASWLFERRYRTWIWAACGFAGGALAAVISSGLYLRSFGSWAVWARSLPAIAGAGFPVEDGNCSPAQIARELTGWDLSIALAAILIAGTLLVMWRSRGSGRVDDLTVIGVGAVLVPLSGSLAWLHYYLFAVPALLFMFRPARTALPTSRDSLVLRALAFASLVLIAGEPLIYLFRLKNPYLMTLQPAIGGLILFGLVLRKLTSPST